MLKLTFFAISDGDAFDVIEDRPPSDNENNESRTAVISSDYENDNDDVMMTTAEPPSSAGKVDFKVGDEETSDAPEIVLEETVEKKKTPVKRKRTPAKPRVKKAKTGQLPYFR